MLPVVAQFLIVHQEGRQAVCPAPTAVLIGVADVFHQLAPVFVARRDFSEECPDSHHGQHDQRRHDEELHQKTGRRRLDRGQTGIAGIRGK